MYGATLFATTPNSASLSGNLRNAAQPALGQRGRQKRRECEGWQYAVSNESMHRCAPSLPSARDQGCLAPSNVYRITTESALDASV
jgi:hypothetical protein